MSEELKPTIKGKNKYKPQRVITDIATEEYQPTEEDLMLYRAARSLESSSNQTKPGTVFTSLKEDETLEFPQAPYIAVPYGYAGKVVDNKNYVGTLHLLQCDIYKNPANKGIA